MKKDIHPKYFPNAKITCACGAEYTVGSTKEETHVEICSNCHPFYTGKQKLVDTAGRLERFQSILKKTKAKKGPKKAKKSAKPKKKAKSKS